MCQTSTHSQNGYQKEDQLGNGNGHNIKTIGSYVTLETREHPDLTNYQEIDTVIIR